MVKNIRHKYLAILSVALFQLPWAEPQLANDMWNKRQYIPNTAFAFFGDDVLSTSLVPSNCCCFSDWLFPNSPLIFSKWRPISQKDSGQQIKLLLGNEVGDPHLMELNGKATYNHTPVNEFYVSLNPQIYMQLGAALEQNDIASSKLSGLRSFLSNKEKVSWFGENLPQSSLLSSWLHLHHNSYGASLYFESGWKWLASPKTGALYPLKINNMHNRIYFREFFLESRFAKGNIVSQESSDFSRFTWKPGIKKEWRGKQLLWTSQFSTELNYSHFEAKMPLENGIEIEISNKPEYLASYNLINKSRYNILDSNFVFQWHSDLSYQQNIFLAETGIKALQNSFLGKSTQEINFSLNHSKFHFGNQQEKWQGLQNNFQNKKFYYESLNAMVSFQSKPLGPVYLEAISRYTNFWNTPKWQVDSLWTEKDYHYRLAYLKNSSAELFQLEQDLKIGIDKKLFQGNLGLLLNENNIFSDSLGEYKASEWSLYFEGNINLPSDLSINWKSQYLGPKYVLGWSQTAFKIKAHWEHNLNISQSFLANRLRLNYSAFHIFGEEILEHPNGNPYRFHILTGLDWNF